MITSQLSQPNCSISTRDMGRNGAVPKRDAQCLRYDVRSLAAAADIEQLLGNGVGAGRPRGHIYKSVAGRTIRAGTYAGQHHSCEQEPPGSKPTARGWIGGSVGMGARKSKKAGK